MKNRDLNAISDFDESLLEDLEQVTELFPFLPAASQGFMGVLSDKWIGSIFENMPRCAAAKDALQHRNVNIIHEGRQILYFSQNSASGNLQLLFPKLETVNPPIAFPSRKATVALCACVFREGVMIKF